LAPDNVQAEQFVLEVSQALHFESHELQIFGLSEGKVPPGQLLIHVELNKYALFVPFKVHEEQFVLLVSHKRHFGSQLVQIFGLVDENVPSGQVLMQVEFNRYA
jgi:hypothetical protein